MNDNLHQVVISPSPKKRGRVFADNECISISDVDISNVDIPNMPILTPPSKKLKVERCTFSNVSLNGNKKGELDNAHLSTVLVTDATIKNISIRNAFLSNIVFDNVCFTDVDFSHTYMGNVVFMNCTLDNVSFHSAILRMVHISNCIIGAIDCSEAAMREVLWIDSGGEETRCNFSGIRIAESSFKNVTMQYSVIKDASLDTLTITQCDMRNSEITGTLLCNVNIFSTSMHNSNFVDSVFDATCLMANSPGIFVRYIPYKVKNEVDIIVAYYIQQNVYYYIYDQHLTYSDVIEYVNTLNAPVSNEVVRMLMDILPVMQQEVIDSVEPQQQREAGVDEHSN